MNKNFIHVAGKANSALLLIADHAGLAVPNGVDLEIPTALLASHIAVDIGVMALGRALCARLECPGVFGAWSRLVVDLNRDPNDPQLVPMASDGHPIPGNRIDAAARQQRLAQYWHPYHDHVAAVIAASRPRLLISLHSFTPQLASRPEEQRPWQVGVLYNRDARAAHTALLRLTAAGVIAGDQQPYSGLDLNATMNRHAEANGIAYLGLEVRQDLIDGDAGAAHWAEMLAPVIVACEAAL